jgi:hypothetical protein
MQGHDVVTELFAVLLPMRRLLTLAALVATVLLPGSGEATRGAEVVGGCARAPLADKMVSRGCATRPVGG